MYVPIRHPSTTVENPLQIDLFMQNKPNVKYAQIIVKSYIKSKYEIMDTWLSGKNKPKTNPKQTQTKPICQSVKLMQSVYLQRITEKKMIS